MDAGDHAQGHGRIAEKAAEHGMVGQGLAPAADRGGEHQPFRIMIIHIDMDGPLVEPEAKAIAALDREERRDVEHLAAFQPFVGL